MARREDWEVVYEDDSVKVERNTLAEKQRAITKSWTALWSVDNRGHLVFEGVEKVTSAPRTEPTPRTEPVKKPAVKIKKKVKRS